jgi:hypothetical protein
MRNLTNDEGDIYTRNLTNDDGGVTLTGTLPIEIIQNNAQQTVNISLKGISGFTANKVIKVNSAGDALEYADDEASNWILNGANLYPLSTSTNILIGTTSNGNGYGVLVIDKEIAIQTSPGSSSSYGLRIVNDGYSTVCYVDNAGNMFWTGALNNYNFSKQLIINTSGLHNELSNGTYIYSLPTTGGGDLALFSQIPTNNLALINGWGYITASSTNTLTNKSISYSQLTGTPTIPTDNLELLNGQNYITASSIPAPLWIRTTFIGGSELSPYNNDIVSIGSGRLIIGSSIEYYELETNFTNNTFQIKEQDGTNVFKYDADNGYVDIGNPAVSGGRTNFGDYTLHGNDTYYPENSGMSFGTISYIFGKTAYIQTITTDNLIITSPAKAPDPSLGQSIITCNDSNEISFSGNKLLLDNLFGANQNLNTIVSHTSYGWQFSSSSIWKMAFPTASSYYPFFGSDATYPFVLHINNIGDTYRITGNNYSNLTHAYLGQVSIQESLTSSSSRFRTNYYASRCYLTNPNGTDNGVSFAGSFLAYHDNGTELALGCPNSAYQYTTSSNIVFQFNGKTRIRMFGTETKTLQFLQHDGATPYYQAGRTSTFPTNMGIAWSGTASPIGNCYYQGGDNTNDTEGFWFAQNGDTTAFSSTADLQALRWYNEDAIISGWYISSAGGITTFSDRRLKTDIKDYKNSCFEKYKQIRTVSYKEKIPEKIRPERLKKQSCLDHYNEKHYGIIAQEIYELYPELNNCCEVRDKKKWDYRKENWENGVYEKEHKEWLEAKEEFECCYEGCEEKDKCCYKMKEPEKIFNEEEPILVFDYQRLNIITIGVVQDLIKELDTVKTELNTYKSIVDKLINATSFKSFKESLV